MPKFRHGGYVFHVFAENGCWSVMREASYDQRTGDGMLVVLGRHGEDRRQKRDMCEIPGIERVGTMSNVMA